MRGGQAVRDRETEMRLEEEEHNETADLHLKLESATGEERVKLLQHLNEIEIKFAEKRSEAGL